MSGVANIINGKWNNLAKLIILSVMYFIKNIIFICCIYLNYLNY